MKKIFKYIFIIFLFLILLIGTSGYFFASKYEDKITESVLNELNKQIETKVDVKDINFSIFGNFPMASLEFTDVFIQSTKDFLKSNPKKDTLIWAKKMSLDFNLFDIYNENYVLTQVRLKDAIVRMHVDKSRNDNFHFIKENQDSSSTKFSVNLNKVILNRVDYRFENTRISNRFKLYAKQFVLSGNLSDEEFGLTTSGSLLLKEIMLDKVNYLMYPNTSLNVDLMVNNSKVEVKSGSLKIGDEYLDLHGSYWFNEQSYIDIAAKSDQMTIQNILRNLPTKQQAALKNFDASGKVAFEMSIKGEASKNKSPNIEINAFVNDAELINRNNNIPLKNLSFSAHYVSSSSLLEVRGFTGQLYSSFAKGNFTVKNFLHPKISADLELESNLKEIKQFLELDSIEDFQGQVNAKIKLNGQLRSNKEVTKADILSFRTSGTIHVKNATATLVDKQNRSIHHLNASLQLENNNVLIDNLDFRFGQSDSKFQGKAYNMLAYLLLENENLNLNGKLHCDSLNMNDILIPDSEKEKTDDEAFNYPQNIACRLEVGINHFTYNKFIASDIYAEFYMNENIVQINNFRMNTSDGSANGKLVLTPKSNGEYELALNSKLSNIEMSKLMYQMDDFGQKSISYTNLHGKLNATTQLKGELKPNLGFKKQALKLVSDFNIVDGELKDYKPLYSMSKFIELSELENIKFDEFKNTIEISDNTLHIPKMSIQSSAIDLKMSGEHNFSNKYLYRMNVLLSEVLGRKAQKNKPENEEFSYIEDDGRGRTSIFLLIEGDGKDMDIKYDTEGVKEHLKKEFQEEKTNIKTILNEEFGIFKNDSSVIKNKETKKENSKEKSTKKNFQIEWEDE